MEKSSEVQGYVDLENISIGEKKNFISKYIQNEQIRNDINTLWKKNFLSNFPLAQNLFDCIKATKLLPIFQ